jgi:hypothetical protein
MQIRGHLLHDDFALQNELLRVVSSMRQHSEPFLAETVHESARSEMWNIYCHRLIDGQERGSFLSSLSPEDHLQVYRWLFPPEPYTDWRQPLYRFMLAQLEENAGHAIDALALYRSILAELNAGQRSTGRHELAMRDAAAAVRRLERR